MKIGIICSEFHPMNAAAAARSGSWVSLFGQLGHEVTIFTSSQANPSQRNLIRSWFRTPSNRAPVAKRFFQEICLGLDIACRIILKANKTEVNVITSPPFFMASLCALACRLVGTPYIFDIRDRYPNVLFELGLLSPSGLPGRLLLALEKIICESSLFVSTVTKGLVDDLRGITCGREPFLSCNGYSETAFQDQHLSNPPLSNFTIVYHGRLGRFYDINVLCEVIEILEKKEPGIKFLMIGELTNLKSRKSWGTVDFMPEMPLIELASILTRCHLGICLLKETDAMRKALPAKTFDYIGAGLPMIVSPSGELYQTVTQRGFGLGFLKNDAKIIAHAITDLYINRNQLKTFRKNIMNDRRKYGRSNQAKDLLKKICKEIFVKSQKNSD
jgi:glycosyltransferase involved in cell wall biosynthesis